MATDSKPLLSLDTLVPHEHIVIDKHPYDLRTADDLSVLEYHQFARLGQRLDVLMRQPHLTDDDGVELSSVLDTICRKALMAPDEAHKRLSDLQRLSIAQVFTSLLQPRLRLSGATVEAPSATVIGATSSRGSRGSMGARRKAG